MFLAPIDLAVVTHPIEADVVVDVRHPLAKLFEPARPKHDIALSESANLGPKNDFAEAITAHLWRIGIASRVDAEGGLADVEPLVRRFVVESVDEREASLD